jgi:general secretion pathway protein H
MYSAGNKLKTVLNTRPAAQQGFTLIELLLVITIVAMLVGLAAPSISRSLPGVQLKSAAREIAAALRHARDTAITRQHQTVISIDIKNRVYSTSNDNKLHHLPDKIDIKVLGAEQESPSETIGGVRFYPDGSSTGGQITLSLDQRHYEIEVDWLLGKVSLKD